MGAVTEKQLDMMILEAFRRGDFCQWVIGRTKFAGIAATLTKGRADHPWTKSELLAIDPLSGEVIHSTHEGETDILVVMESNDDGRRFALHIENKLGTGRFRPRQPELYAARAKQWVANPKYGNYMDWQTVLMAPKRFVQAHEEDARKFDVIILHEELAQLITGFPVT